MIARYDVDRTPPAVEDKNDLGFGAVVGADSRQRLLNKDGSFNVRRRGLRWFESHSPYHLALNATWPRFLLGCVAIYTALNVLFAAAFWLCGADALIGASSRDLGGIDVARVLLQRRDLRDDRLRRHHAGRIPGARGDVRGVAHGADEPGADHRTALRALLAPHGRDPFQPTRWSSRRSRAAAA